MIENLQQELTNWDWISFFSGWVSMGVFYLILDSIIGKK